MNRVSQGDVEYAIWRLEEHFGVNYNGLTNRECINNLRKLCPKLHSDEQLKTFADNLLTEIYNKFGYKGLRIWYSVYIKYGFCVHENIYMKYDKLCHDIYDFVNKYREDKGITLNLDVFLAVVFLREIYKKRFGVFNDELLRLHSLLQTIHLSGYNEKIINEVIYLIETELWMQGDNYYHKQDLHDKNILKELYLHVAEEIGNEEEYKGFNIFYDYDGYGNISFNS